jgi:lipoate-protein ligase A
MGCQEMNAILWEIEENPAYAMARDEVVLNTSENGTTWWRFYRWLNPAMTIGVFCSLAAVPPIPWARRITGGGLVLHGHDLTFTVVTDDQPSKTAYRQVGQAIVNALQYLGISAELKGDTQSQNGTYACFSEPVGGDVLVDGRKIAGYAMRRRRGRILIQGSLALSVPPDILIHIVAEPEEYRRNSIALDAILPTQDAVQSLTRQIAGEFTKLFTLAQNFEQLEGIEGKIIAQYIQKYSDPEIVPARR